MSTNEDVSRDSESRVEPNRDDQANKQPDEVIVSELKDASVLELVNAAQRLAKSGKASVSGSKWRENFGSWVLIIIGIILFAWSYFWTA